MADVSTDEEDFDYSQPSQEDATVEDAAAQEAGPGHARTHASGAAGEHAGRAGDGAEQTAVATLPDRYAPPGREGWATRNKHKYACQAGGPQVLEENERIALQLDRLSDNYKTQQPGEWRQYTYSKAAKIVRGLTFKVSSASQLRELNGIGNSVAAKIQEIIDTGGRRQPAELAVVAVPPLARYPWAGLPGRTFPSPGCATHAERAAEPLRAAWEAAALPRGPIKAADSAAFGT